MEDIKTRLKETADECLNCYEKWSGDQKNGKAREAVAEAVHELRKVASRLEIELAISERDQMAQKPIPIPPHRDAQNRSHDSGAEKNYNVLDDDRQNGPKPPRRRQQHPPRNAG